MALGGNVGDRLMRDDDSEAPAPNQRTGQWVAGRYRLDALLGQGGMGAVYEAFDRELGRVVAIKTWLPAARSSAPSAERLIREARAAASVGHPGIVQVFDLIREGDGVFIVMERLIGEELRARIARQGQLPLGLVVRLGVEVAGAIAAAHAHQILHRDLKPGNIFITHDPRLGETFKVLDFGLAKAIAPQALQVHTSSGQFLGTPLYTAPERLAGDGAIDGRADVYAIGVVLYEAITGRPPFQAKHYPELLLKLASQSTPPLVTYRSCVPEGLSAVVMRAVAKNPDQRFPSAAALRDAFAALNPAHARSGEPTRARADATLPVVEPTTAGPSPRSLAPAVGDTSTQTSALRPPRLDRRWTRAMMVAVGLSILLSLWVTDALRRTARQPTAPSGLGAPGMSRASASPQRGSAQESQGSIHAYESRDFVSNMQSAGRGTAGSRDAPSGPSTATEAAGARPAPAAELFMATPGESLNRAPGRAKQPEKSAGSAGSQVRAEVPAPATMVEAGRAAEPALRFEHQW
jgi:serine/threonine-protein kinase